MTQIMRKCPWCDSSKRTPHVRRKDGVMVLRCDSCGLCSVEGTPRKLDDLYDSFYFLKPGQEGYQDEGYSDYESIPDSEFSWRLNLLSLFTTGTGRLLDIGCATGKFVELALAAGWDAEGIDVSQYAVQIARQKGLKVHLGTVESLAVSPQSFDVVTAFDVMEHIWDLRSFLEAIRIILRPGGKLILLSPNAGSFRAIALSHKWIGYTTSLEHVHYFDMRFLRHALAEIFQDRHLTVAAFERGEYDYLLGVAEKGTSDSSGTPRETHMRVLFVNRSDSFWKPGGDVVQMLATKRHLEDLGVEIDISLSEHPVGVGYDLAHLFNSQIPHQEFEQFRHLKQVGLPVCLSTIYWDQTETIWADTVLRAVFATAKDEAQLDRYLGELRDHSLMLNGLSPTSPSPLYAAMRSVQKRLFEAVDHLLPNSHLEIREISLRHGICNKPHTVVPNGVDPGIFLEANPDPFIHEYGVKDFVILAGRLEGRKNQLLALYALRNEPLRTVVIGSQADSDYTRLCKKWAAPNALFIEHLPQNKLASAFAAARVCLLPSWMESTGLVALEAALADCSLVVTNRGATWEYFGDLVYYCDPSDPESIREATMAAYSNFERDRSKREALRKVILSSYNWRRAAEKTLEGYKTAVAAQLSKPECPEADITQRGQCLVSIIIPVFNKVEYTARCLQALEVNTSRDLRYEVIIIDNASTDATPGFLASLEGPVTVIRNEKNLGFARACNQGAALANGDYLVFLNNDTEPQPGWLDALLARAQDENVGIVGAKLLFPDGTIQHAGVAIARDPLQGVDVAPFHIYYRSNANLAPVNKPRDFQAVTGACMLIMKPLFDMVGGFNEAYYNGYEDVDLCFRVRSLGYRIVYEPRSVLIHHESVSGPERFRKVRDNVVLLNSYWAGKIQPDEQDIYLADGFFARFVRNGDKWRKVVRPFPAVSIELAVDRDQAILNQCLQSLVKWTPFTAQLTLVGSGANEELQNWALSLWEGPIARAEVGTEETRVGEIDATRFLESACEYGVFMDASCVVSRGWLEELLKTLESSPRLGAVVCFSGKPQPVECCGSRLKPMKTSEVNASTNAPDGFQRAINLRQKGLCVVVRGWVAKEVAAKHGPPPEPSPNLTVEELCRNIEQAGYHLRVMHRVRAHHESTKTECSPDYQATDLSCKKHPAAPLQ